MRRISTTAVFLFTVALIASTATAITPVINFQVDLDLDPSMRWTGAARAIVNAHGWNNSFGPVFEYYDKLLFSTIPAGVTSKLEQHILTSWPLIHSELQSIATDFAAVGHPEINVTVLAGWVYFYELSHVTHGPGCAGDGGVSLAHTLRACTGILALPADKSKQIVHGRNMDLYPFALRNMTLQVEFIQDGKLVFEGLGWSWITTSFLTSSRVGGLTMNGDWRTEEGTYTLDMILARIFSTGNKPLIFYFRDLVQSPETDLAGAIETLTGMEPAAPFYMIMSGTQRNGVIASVSWDRNKTHLAHLNDYSPYWFMVQTNYDRWEPNPESDPRATVAINTMNALGRTKGATDLGVWMTISEFPVHNGGTVYSAILSVNKTIWSMNRMAMATARPYYPPH